MATGSSQSLNSFVRAHSTQLKALPVGLWKILHHKLQHQLLGVSSNFSIQQDDIGRGIIIYTPTNETEKILRKDSDLWIIPHQFTYESDNLRKQITVDRDLRNLVLKISSLKTGEKCQVHSVEDEIENAIKSIWSLVETYTITVMNDQNQPEQKYLWYLKDEFGSLLTHSDNPNFRTQVFFHLDSMIAYTLVYPIQDVHTGTLCSRDYTEGIADELQRAVLSLATFPEKLSDPDRQTQFIRRHETRLKKYTSDIANSDVLSSALEQFSIGEENNSYPDTFTLPVKSKYKVYTDCHNVIRDSLKDTEFVYTNDLSDADIIWVSKTWKTWMELSDTQVVNQFEGENSITVKDLLIDTLYQFYGIKATENWYPTSYNLNTDPSEWLGDYIIRNKAGNNNIWIVKPWNATRSMGITVSSNVSEILRQLATGPKIISKYIENPALLSGRKFDIRVTVVLDSASPLRLYALEDTIYPRISNKPYNLTQLDDFQRHLTVMQYANKGYNVKLCPNPEFVKRFNTEFHGTANIVCPDGETVWDVVRSRIYTVIRKTFVAAVLESPISSEPKLKHRPNSKAIYGVDIILDEHLNPFVTEVSMVPDTNKLLSQYPKLYGDVFKFLFVKGGKEDESLRRMFVRLA